MTAPTRVPAHRVRVGWCGPRSAAGLIGLVLLAGAAGACRIAEPIATPAALASDVPGATPDAEPAQRLLPLVRNGQSDYTIVCSPDAHRATLLATGELQKYIEQITGVRLPVLAERPKRGPVIMVQADPSLPREGFRLQVRGRDLWITGHDTAGDPERIVFQEPVLTGTLSGVYELLERFAGVRFYWPDELGRVVPKSPNLLIPADLDHAEAPYFLMRRLWGGPEQVTLLDEAATRRWGRQLRLGASHSTWFHHNWHRLLNVEAWAKRGHPEYAALVDGVRRAQYRDGRKDGQFCTSNPEVLQIVAEEVRSWRPPDVMVSICANDGFGCFCQCPRCRALDPGRLIPDGKFKGRADLSDRLMRFNNEIAERSGRQVSAYAYNEYVEVPLREKPHDRLTVVLALNNALQVGDDGERRRAERLCRQWGEYMPRVFAYDIMYLGMSHLPGPVPVPMGAEIEQRIRLFADSKLRGALLYITPTMEQGGPDAYVAAKLLWNPRLDAEQLRQEYYRDLYGPAAPAVQRLYQRAGDAWKRSMARRPSKQQAWLAVVAVANDLRAEAAAAQRAAHGHPRIEARVKRLVQMTRQMTEKQN